MFLDRSTYKKVIAWLFFFILILGLGMLSPALAKGGKTKNAQHGRGEAFRGALEHIQKGGVLPVVGKRGRVKEAAKLRNKIKAIGKKIRGENHSMKQKR